MKFRLLLFIIGLFVGSANVVAQEGMDGAAAQVSDVRVIIDISGSMKKNDPNNLRIPALRLLTELIPEGQQAGVWTFGQYVNMLVKHGPVDKAWKKNAYKLADEISSAGLYTNIEGVLEKSTWDWKRPEPGVNRSIIFLTDGVVDISKDQEKNKASRQRILTDTLSRLQKAGAKINTIALSDDADKPFLRQLSSNTGGWFETIKDADQLERVFFKMFQKSVPVETVPLTDNKVLVDDSIRELTLLIFRDKGEANAGLVQPDGVSFDHEKTPDNVRWRHEDRYDLITIDKPMAGEWKVEAKLDPDNRVMVVTDLKVRASRMPNMILAGDQLPYYVELHENGKVITKREFLDFVHVGLTRSSNGVDQGAMELNDLGQGVDKQEGDGRFSTKVDGNLPAGVYDYEMMVDGITFKRSKRDTMRVVDKPVAVTVTEEQPGDPALYSLTLTPFADIINPDSMLIDAKITKQGGASRAITIPRAGPTEWRFDTKVRAGEIYEVTVSVEAERPGGETVTFDLGTFQLGTGSVDAAVDQPVEPPAEVQPSIVPDLSKAVMSAPTPVPESAPEITHEPAPTPTTEEAPQHTPEPPPGAEPEAEQPAAPAAEGEPVVEEEEKPDWTMVAVKVIVLNGVLIGIGFFAYRKWFRANKDEANNGEEEAAKEEAKNDD